MTEKRNQYEQTFAIIANDPSAWLEYAYGMKMTAQLILQSFLEIVDQPISRPECGLNNMHI